MKVVIDRFEGEIAVLEKNERTTFSIPRSHLPQESREGDVLDIENDEIRVDVDETARRKQIAEKLLDELWK